ncbi:isoflavone reductase family protein [Paraphaeosphaeria sporulosa]
MVDEGQTKISFSTWAQIGRAVAALISLPIKSETEACLDKFRNKIVLVSSFTVNQEDMCASVL